MTADSFKYGEKVFEHPVANRTAGTLGADEVRPQSRASSAASVSDSPIFAKVKSWLERKKQTEPT